MAFDKAFINKNFLMLGLVVSLLFGLVCPWPGIWCGSHLTMDIAGKKRGLPQLAVVIIFVNSGLGLASLSKLNHPKALVFGILFVLFITPTLCWPIITFLKNIVDLTLLQGLSLFCAVPTTLSSGVAMVQNANGNVPLAIFLTTVTNLLGVFTMPFTMTFIFQGASVQIKPQEMLFELSCLTLLPLLVGLILKFSSTKIATFAKDYKAPLTKMQNCCIFCVVWLMTSKAQSKIMGTAPLDLLVCAILAILIHVVYRFATYFAANAAQLGPEEWICVVLMCSQKSLPVCVSVLSCLPAELQAKSGVLIVPCIMCHFSQLMIDGFLAIRWKVPEQELKENLLSNAK
jgi:sodium/bile acid cotransporter 7